MQYLPDHDAQRAAIGLGRGLTLDASSFEEACR
jgi:hypothetical protein